MLTPPPGGRVSLDFTGTLSPPSGGSVTLNFSSSAPNLVSVTVGLNDAYGLPTVALQRAVVAPAGILSETWQHWPNLNPTIARVARYIVPTGWDSATVSNPYQVSWRQYFYPVGFMSFGYNIEQVPVPLTRYFGAYTPPPGSSVTLNFATPLSPPPGSSVVLEFGATALTTVYSATLGNTANYGVTVVTLGGRIVSPTGFLAGAMGTPSLQGFIQTIAVSPGIAPGVFPVPAISKLAQQILPNGFLATLWGTAKIDLWTKYLAPGGIAPVGFGATHVTHDLQYIDQAGNGIQAGAFGNQRISYSVQSVFPVGVVPGIFGNTRVGIPQYLTASGWLGDGYGSPTVALKPLEADFVSAGDQSAYGQALVWLYTRWVGAFNSNQGEQFGLQKIENYVRSVKILPFNNSVDPAGYGTAYIENANKVLVTTGNVMSRYGIPNLYNAAYQLLVTPIPPGGFGTTYIAPRIQYVLPQGWDGSYITAAHQVWANRQWLYPTSITSAEAFGASVTINKNQIAKQIFPYEGETFGIGYIDFGVRTLGAFSIAYPPAALPDIRFNPYPINPLGWESYGPGGTIVYGIQKIIAPHGIRVADEIAVPTPFVENRNKTLAPYGPHDEAFGFHKIDLWVKYLLPEGDNFNVWGYHNISYRTKVLAPLPIQAPLISVLHRIKNNTPDPPGQQVFQAPAIGGDPPDAWGLITINLRTLYPVGIVPASSTLPNPTATSYGILPKGIFSDEQLGTPFIPYTQYADLTNNSIPKPPETGETWGKPRVDPHTIWAPHGAPDDAIRNNGPDGDVIKWLGATGMWYEFSFPWFGLTTVSNQYRAVYPDTDGDHYSLFGAPSVDYGTHYVYPRGLNSLRMGAINFLGIPQYINMDDGNYPGTGGTAFGAQTVGPPPWNNNQLNPLGLLSQTFGNTSVDWLNRTRAIPSLGDQSLYSDHAMVGTRRWFPFAGWDSSLYGTLMIAYRIRHVYPEGDDMLIMQPDFYHYADRMRVRGDGTVTVPSLATGEKFGTGAWVTGDQRGLNQGGFSILSLKMGDARVSHAIVPVGWNDTVFGDVQRYVPGTISVQGGDMARYGQAIVQSVIGEVPSILPGVPGIPSTGQPIYTTGMPPVGFAGPTLTDEYGCSQRYFVMTPILPGSVGQPLVTT